VCMCVCILFVCACLSLLDCSPSFILKGRVRNVWPCHAIHTYDLHTDESYQTLHTHRWVRHARMSHIRYYTHIDGSETYGWVVSRIRLIWMSHTHMNESWYALHTHVGVIHIYIWVVSHTTLIWTSHAHVDESCLSHVTQILRGAAGLIGRGQCVAVCCSMLQCVAVCYSECIAVNLLQCVAVCCSVFSALQCIARVLQCVAPSGRGGS